MISLPVLLAVSITLGLLPGIFTYIILISALSRKAAVPAGFISISAAVYSILFAAVFLLIGVLINRSSREHRYMAELQNFKSFTDALHQASSEIEVYEALYSHITGLPPVDYATLFYSNDKSSDNMNIQKLTNDNAQLCSMSPRNCPLIQSGYEYMEICIGKSIPCDYQLPKYQSGSYVCLPIIDSGFWLSVLQLYSRNEDLLEPANIAKIKSYIEITRAVIHSKQAIRSLSQKASTDRLTKLYNRSFLEPYLDNQLEAANLSSQQLSLIMIDLDHFKIINDNFGHAAGDYILKIFAEQVQKCIRKTDLLARYGGDEFIAVLPSTNMETAEVIAERIRQTVEAAGIPPFDGMDLPPITCSVGVSTYPAHCDSKDSLIKSADVTLYKAKQAGRNCTKIYGRDVPLQKIRTV